MTPEKAKELLPIIKAFSEGKIVQHLNDISQEWADKEFPTFSDKPSHYRIKPEPTYRPFDNAQECIDELKKHEPFGWVKDVDDEEYDNILFVNDETDEDGNIVKGKEACNVRTENGGYQNFGYYFEFYTFLDGTPFGIMEG